jgi:hypothetical protein
MHSEKSQVFMKCDLVFGREYDTKNRCGAANQPETKKASLSHKSYHITVYKIVP